jgi:L-amino acid N-acyltransferase YncA
MPTTPQIRLATPADLAAINAIYNRYVVHSTCTYQTEPTTDAEREAWFAARGLAHPVTVAETSGEILGWGSLSKFRERAAYDRTVENAVYVRHDQHRRGIGSALLVDLIERATALNHHVIMAVIDADQPGSISLHARHGFEEVGRLKEVGRKFDRWLNAVYMQRTI